MRKQEHLQQINYYRLLRRKQKNKDYVQKSKQQKMHCLYQPLIPVAFMDFIYIQRNLRQWGKSSKRAIYRKGGSV